MKHFRLKTLIITLITLLAFLNMAGHTLAEDVQGEIIAEAPLTQVQAKPTSNLVLGETYYTIMFKTATAGAIKTVEMEFPAGFNLTGAKFIEREIIGAGTLSVSGQTLIYKVSAATPPSIAAGKKIKIMVGGILNNTVTTPQVVTVTTKDASSVIIDGPTASADPVLTQIQNLMIADSAVTSSKIADGTIGSADLAAGSVGSAQIADGSVTSADLAAGSVSSAQITDGSVTGADIAGDTLTSADIAPGAVGSSEIADGTIGSADITDGTIGNVDLAAGSYPNITGVGTLGSLTVSDVANLATTSGNVGIGTTGLYQKLTVNGTIGFKDGTTPLLMNSEGCCSVGNRMIWAHSPSYSTWGIYYNDTNDKMYWQTGTGSEIMAVAFGTKRLGIGTVNPLSRLHIYSADNPTVLRLHSSAAPGKGRVEFWSDPEGSTNLWRPGFIESTDQGSFTGGLAFYVNGTGSANKTSSMEVMRITNGNVGIGTTAPAQKLHVAGAFLRVDGAGAEQAYIGGDGWGGDVQIGSLNSAVSAVALYNGGSGTYMDLYIRSLHIMGGADLAEPFNTIDAEEIRPGMVVAIDPEHPGNLRVAARAYDKTVAGVVSGANGINPGVTMTQEGTAADGTVPVALTGRVYAWVDASYGAIEPGDLLTTSDTPGHAMKVTDHTKAHGTIIGKAMTTLKEGKGLVLVLVSLQ